MKSYIVRLDIDNEYTEQEVEAFKAKHPQGSTMSDETAVGLLYAAWLKEHADRLAWEHAFTMEG